MKTKEKKESSFLNRLFTGVSLVYLLLGVLLIVIPDLQMEYVCYGISVVLEVQVRHLLLNMLLIIANGLVVL